MSWQELLSNALVGTARRPGTTPERLLDTAAVRVVQGRAGRIPGSLELPAPVPAPLESSSAVGPAAGRRLAHLLARGRTDLLREWLAAVAERGLIVPPELLPALLDRGAADRSLRGPIAAAAGARGGWLATQEASWAYLADEDPGAVPDERSGEEVWQFGSPGERRRELSRLRGADRDRARVLLQGVWPQEKAATRLAFLDVLAENLLPDDEDFLEQVLDDRSAKVRRRSTELLARLPDSAYGARMAARVAPLLTLDRGGLTVEPPEHLDDTAERDGIIRVPPQGQGQRQWWLRQMLSRTPLHTWIPRLGPSAERILRHPMPQPWGDLVVAGLTEATIAQHDVGWARALFPLTSRVAPVLPIVERQECAAAMLERQDWLEHGHDLLASIPAPWTGRLAVQVVRRLRNSWESGFVENLAAERLDPAYHDRFDPEGELARTLFFRYSMLKEL